MKSVTTKPAPKTAPVELDGLLSVTQAAIWLGLSRRVLLENIRRKKIPAIRVNERVLRIHPRSVLIAKGAKL